MKHLQHIYEFVVPMGISLEEWKKMQKKGMTAKKYHEEHPGKKFKVVHGHKRGEVGKPLPGATNLSYEKASKQHKAIVLNERNIKSFNEFDKIDEELTQNQRLILNLPRFALSYVLQNIFDIFPNLNFRWRDLKKSTKDSKFQTLMSSGSTEVMKNKLTKITRKDLPKNNMKMNMMFRDWNIYLSERKSNGGSYGPNAVERSVVYLSKDEVKLGDKYTGYRLRDEDIYPDFEEKKKKREHGDLPIIVLVARFDQQEKISDIQEYVDDICLYFEDEYPINLKPRFNNHGDYLSIGGEITEPGKTLTLTEDLLEALEDVAGRTKDYLNNNENYNFNYEIVFSVEGPFYYFGRSGRFSQIEKKAFEYARRWHSDSDFPLIDRRNRCFNISRMWATHDKDLKITSDDIRTLWSDIDECSTHYTKNNYKKYPVTDIKIKTLSIRFNQGRP